MSASICYITVGPRAEALAIGRALVEERLAACANLLDGAVSIYRWQGKIEQDDEVVLIAKTRTELVDRLIARVRALHSYDCPCVVALPIEQGNAEYLAWIKAETRMD